VPRGGKRTPSEGKKLGRPKNTRPVDGNTARKIKARVRAEELWVFVVAKAVEKAKNTGNTADLRQALVYLDDRDLGRCMDTVNHMHDKPQEINLRVSLSEVIAKARKRADALRDEPPQISK
jgi:hypothetical protein